MKACFFIMMAGFLFFISACSDRAERSKNLVLISIDTLRPDHLGCYGYERNTSPLIDEIAASGVLFADATASSPWTLPSHASLLTGLYPNRHGVKNIEHRLSDRTPALATRLGKKGYRTMAIVNSGHLSRRNGLNQGFELFEYVSEWATRNPRDRRVVNRGPEIIRKGIEWLGRPDRRPFFLFLHFFDVHSDYRPAAVYKKMFTHPYQGKITGQTDQLVLIRARNKKISEADRRHLVDLYDAEIRQLSDSLRDFMHFLDRSGLTDSTYVVLTSDHGEEFMEHGSILHGRTYYQEVIAIPLLFRGPGIPRGMRIEEPVSIVDVMPTVLKLLGYPAEAALSGDDLSQFWTRETGDRTASKRYLFAEADWMNEKPDMKRMVRYGNFKLCYNRLTGEKALFDLKKDPEESRNLGDLESQRLHELMSRLNVFMGQEVRGEKVETPARETLDRLRQLGYMQ